MRILFHPFSIQQWVTFQSKKLMLPSQLHHTHFSHNYHILQAGLNRIRFLQKRQNSNSNTIAHRLNRIVGRFSQQKAREGPGSAEREKQNGFGGDWRHEGGRGAMTRVNTSRKKLKIFARRGKYRMQTTQEDSSLLKISQDLDDTPAQHLSDLLPASPLVSKQSPVPPKIKQVLEQRTNNYRHMKQRQHQMDVIRHLRTEQSQRALRQKVLEAAVRRQQGRKKIEDRYFQYIDSVHQEKDRQRQRRNRMTEKKIEQMLKLQLQEKDKIEQFQSSLALEEHLKSFLKEKIPIKLGQQSRKEKQSFFM